MFNIDNITRKNIRELIPYSSAREEYSGIANIWLDANENPYDTDVNRYPDPFQMELKEALAKIKEVETHQIFIGNGSDEVIDLLFRAFCEPEYDKAYIFPPTYSMYEVSAKINNIGIVKLNLRADFELPDTEDIKSDLVSKGLLFICSPNNPTGNLYSISNMKEIADNFDGLVVVDEAYIDFSNSASATSLICNTPNLVVLQTMSKAYGSAGLRIGMAFANQKIVSVLNRIKPPYNISTLSQLKALEIIKNSEAVRQQVTQIQIQRDRLIGSLASIGLVKKTYPTEANFILVEFEDAEAVFSKLQDKGIIVRNRTSQVEGCLRITVGTSEQNAILIDTLKEITV